MKQRISIGTLVVTFIASMIVSGGALAGPARDEAKVAASDVSTDISYQGYLTDPGGNPLDGDYVLEFELWDAESGGTQLWSETHFGLQVEDGLFDVQLSVDQDNFAGEELWLAIKVNGQLLSPRQEILPVPYALSLRPGARVSASVYDGPVLEVENTDADPAGGGYALVGRNASGYTWRPAIYGENTGASAGVYGRSDGWHATVGYQGGGSPDYAGVYGHNTGDGPGVMGESDSGMGVQGLGPVGVYGESEADFGEAVHGHGTGSYTEGILGTATGDHAAAIYGIASGSGSDSMGVFGQATNGFGVYATSTNGDGVYGEASAADKSGVFGRNDTNIGVRGAGNKGVFGESGTDYGEAVHGKGTGLYTEGVLGESAHSAGVYGISGGAESYSVGVFGATSATYGLATQENIFVGGSCTGCTIAYIAQNADGGTLQAGDVVAVAGIAPALDGHETPVLSVRRALSTDTGLLGVAQAGASVGLAEMPAMDEGILQGRTVEMVKQVPGDIASGDYLFVVVQGLVRMRVDASSSAIQVGDALGPGKNASGAQKLSSAAPTAALVGHALEPLAEGSGLIWVLLLGQ
jgi:hypothetical protein